MLLETRRLGQQDFCMCSPCSNKTFAALQCAETGGTVKGSNDSSVATDTSTAALSTPGPYVSTSNGGIVDSNGEWQLNSSRSRSTQHYHNSRNASMQSNAGKLIFETPSKTSLNALDQKAARTCYQNRITGATVVGDCKDLRSSREANVRTSPLDENAKTDAGNSNALSSFPVAVPSTPAKAMVPPEYTLAGPSDRYYWRKGDPQDKPLGSGYTSTVHRGLDAKTGEPVAIKLVPKNKQRLLATDEYYRRLYHRLPQQSHPTVLRLRDFLEDENHFYIVSDLCTGPDLVDYVLEFTPRTIPMDDIRSLVLQILLGVHHLHSRGLIHRDIKLDNILFTDEKRKQIAIVDFDMSLMTDYPEPPRPPKTPDEISVVGTKDYMAPEGYRGEYSEGSDLWSVGVVLYILLDGHFPYDLADVAGGREVREVLRRGVTVSPEVMCRSPEAVDLVLKLLEFDVRKRISSAWDALRHPWFSTKSKYSKSPAQSGARAMTNCCRQHMQSSRTPTDDSIAGTTATEIPSLKADNKMQAATPKNAAVVFPSVNHTANALITSRCPPTGVTIPLPSSRQLQQKQQPQQHLSLASPKRKAVLVGDSGNHGMTPGSAAQQALQTSLARTRLNVANSNVFQRNPLNVADLSIKHVKQSAVGSVDYRHHIGCNASPLSLASLVVARATTLDKNALAPVTHRPVCFPDISTTKTMILKKRHFSSARDRLPGGRGPLGDHQTMMFTTSSGGSTLASSYERILGLTGITADEDAVMMDPSQTTRMPLFPSRNQQEALGVPKQKSSKSSFEASPTCANEQQQLLNKTSRQNTRCKAAENNVQHSSLFLDQSDKSYTPKNQPMQAVRTPKGPRQTSLMRWSLKDQPFHDDFLTARGDSNVKGSSIPTNRGWSGTHYSRRQERGTAPVLKTPQEWRVGRGQMFPLKKIPGSNSYGMPSSAVILSDTNATSRCGILSNKRFDSSGGNPSGINMMTNKNCSASCPSPPPFQTLTSRGVPQPPSTSNAVADERLATFRQRVSPRLLPSIRFCSPEQNESGNVRTFVSNAEASGKEQLCFSARPMAGTMIPCSPVRATEFWSLLSVAPDFGKNQMTTSLRTDRGGPMATTPNNYSTSTNNTTTSPNNTTTSPNNKTDKYNTPSLHQKQFKRKSCDDVFAHPVKKPVMNPQSVGKSKIVNAKIPKTTVSPPATSGSIMRHGTLQHCSP